MASNDRKSQGKRNSPVDKPPRKKSAKLRYLFLNGELMKVLFISRPRDEIELWSYPKHERAVYTYSTVRKNMEKAFTTLQVAKMVNRNKITLKRAIDSGDIERPQATYGLTEIGKEHYFMWCEKDIMALHAVLLSRHAGGGVFGPGRNNPKNLPNAREIRAMIRHETILYAKTDDGKFVPTWQAEQF